MIVGLGPGLRGANRTGRPFTGDFAGDLLYRTLIDFSFASGVYKASPDDGLRLVDAAVSNAVRCVPPQNKPLPSEINNCRQFLAGTITAMPRLRAILALGRISHDSVAIARGLPRKDVPFSHGAVYPAGPKLVLYDSYHCSRLNTNTGILTNEMFRAVFAAIRGTLGKETGD